MATQRDRARQSQSPSHGRPRRLRDRVGRENLAIAGRLDISCLLKASLLPSKMLILLAGACLGWIGLLATAFMAFTGSGVTAAWIFAGALLFALIVWTVVMAGEFRGARLLRSSPLSLEGGAPAPTSPLPRRGLEFSRTRQRLTFVRRFQPLNPPLPSGGSAATSRRR